MRTGTLIVLSAALLVTGDAFCQGVQFARPYIEGFNPLDDEPYAVTQIGRPHPVLLKMQSKIFKDSSIIDFERRQITFERSDALGFIVWEYHYGELSDYLLAQRNYGLYHGWWSSTLNAGSAAQDKSSPLKLQWELPVQYPSWAQRVLGKDPPKLSIEGSLTIKLSYDDQSVERQTGSSNTNLSSPGFNFEENSKFTIKGSVGRLININITENSDEGFQANNPLKNFKIEYKEATPGELEDEVVQEVVAGYTGFEMPGTSLSGYSESHEGLFGIKIKSKLGPLTLTTIASNEQGEAETKTLNGQSAGGGMTVYTEDQYLPDKYFFLDTMYRSYWNRRNCINCNGTTAVIPPSITNLQVWRQITDKTQISNLNNNLSIVRSAHINGSGDVQSYQRLVENQHYVLYRADGYIRFLDSVSITANDVIAIYMQTSDGKTKGDTTINKAYGDTAMKDLWVLKKQNLTSDSSKSDSTYPLMWRNVYRLPDQDMASFKIQVLYTPIGQDSTPNYGSQLYSDILGLTKNGVSLSDHSYIYDVADHVLIIPPYDTSMHGNEPFNNPALGNGRDSIVYHYPPEALPNLNNSYIRTFKIVMTGSTKQTTFDLGYGVMPGTDIVKANGLKFERNLDYSINYEMGTLELTSARAKAADNVQVQYQRDALFVPDKKVFLGARGEVELPFIGDGSLVGMSVLYQNASSTNDIPKIGQEPYSKILLDANTKINFEPEWMTPLLNKFPLIKTTAPSSVGLEVEVAHSIMNPNTDGQAYVDDFESSSQIYDFGTNFATWHFASSPYVTATDPVSASDSTLIHPPAWNFYWFTPNDNDGKNRIPKANVWDLSDQTNVSTADNGYQSLLRLNCTPALKDSSGVFKNAWAGIMTPIPTSFSDRTNDRYLELLIKCDDTIPDGKLIIQLGQMREALPLNGGPPDFLDHYEDTNHVRVNYYDPNLDIGLAGLRDTAQFYVIPNASQTAWDTLRMGNPLLKNPKNPCGDQYQPYDVNHVGNYPWVNGTRGDGYLTSEDINNDGTITKFDDERYYSFTIDLSDTNSPLIDTTAKLVKGQKWHLYRIPLHDNLPNYPFKYPVKDSFNGPSWKQVTMARMIWTGFDPNTLAKEHHLIFGEIQFDGNQWEPAPVQVTDSLSVSKITPGVISTDENAEYAASVKTTPYVHLYKDDLGNYRNEQSLKLDYNGLVSGDIALVRRNMSYQALNLSSYDTLSVVVHADSTSSSHNELRYVFRFGTDDSTFYECRRRLQPGWNNLINIDLRALSNMKKVYTQDHPNSAIDTANADSTLLIHSPAQMQPNFSNVIWMAMGVIRGYTPGNDSISGEIWVDELKVIGTKSLDGWAARASFTTKFADIATIGASMDYADGDFRSMTDNDIAAGNSSLAGSLNGSLSLDKFLPQEWGVTIPVGGQISGTLIRPQLEPNTDIYINNDATHKPDNISDMAGDWVNMATGKKLIGSDTTNSEHFESQSITENVYTSYLKQRRSDNPIVDLTLDRLTTAANYNMTATKTLHGQREQDSSGDYYIIDTTKSYTGKISYDLTPHDPPSWTNWKPLTDSVFSWLPQYYKAWELTMAPTKLSFDLFDVTYGKTYDLDKSDSANYQNPIAHLTNTFNMAHRVNFSYNPFNPLLQMDYSLGVNRNFQDIFYKDSLPGINYHTIGPITRDYIFKMDPSFGAYGILWGETDRAQRLTLRSSPQFFDFLTHNVDFTCDYKGNMTQGLQGADSTNYLNTDINNTLNFSSTFSTKEFFLGLGKIKGLSLISGAIGKGFDLFSFQSVTFTYSVASELKNSYLDDAYLDETLQRSLSSVLEYELGLEGRTPMDVLTGNFDDNKFGGMRYRMNGGVPEDQYQNDMRSATRTYKFTTSVQLPAPFEIQFSPISFGWSTRYSKHPDTTYVDSTITLPDLTIGANTKVLDKIVLVNTYMQGVDVSSNFSYKNSRTITGIASSPADTSAVIDCQPLLGITGTVKKWPIHTDYKLIYTDDRNSSDGLTEKKIWGNSLGLSYDIDQASKLSEIKVFTLTIPVKGRTTIGAEAKLDNVDAKTKGVETDQENTFTLTPHLTYVFTDNVKGTAQYQFISADVNNVKTTTNNFSLTAEINF